MRDFLSHQRFRFFFETSIHLIKDFLNEFPIIIRRFPQTDEKFGLLFSQIDRITGCDDQPGMVVFADSFAKEFFILQGTVRSCSIENP